MKAACSSSRKRNPNCNSVVSDWPSHCKTWSSTKGTKTYERECKWWAMRLLHLQLLMQRHYTPCSSQLEYGTRDPVPRLWISGSLWVCNTWTHHCWEIICAFVNFYVQCVHGRWTVPWAWSVACHLLSYMWPQLAVQYNYHLICFAQ